MPEPRLIPGLTLDTTKEGLEAFFKQPWHAQVYPELLTRESFISSEIHKFCKENEIKGTQRIDRTAPVSRASVINFLNSLVDQGILGYNEETGKGGYHRVYYPKMTRDEFEENAIYTILMKLIILCPNKVEKRLKPDG